MKNKIIWKLYKGVLMPFSAPHIDVLFDKKQEKLLFKKYKPYFIKWVSEWDRKQDAEYYYVIKDTFEGMKEYSSNTRNQVRKGLKLCEVRKIDLDFVLEYGYPVFERAYSRYNDNVPDKYYFNKIYEDVRNKSEFFGVFNRETNELVGFAENQVKDNACIYGSVKLDPKFLKNYSSYALFHEMNDYYLNDRKVLYVSDGARNLSHVTGIQSMLINKFKFKKVYCRLNISYAIHIKFIVSLLYFFRNFIYRMNGSFFSKLAVILKHEEIRRSYV